MIQNAGFQRIQAKNIRLGDFNRMLNRVAAIGLSNASNSLISRDLDNCPRSGNFHTHAPT